MIINSVWFLHSNLRLGKFFFHHYRQDRPPKALHDAFNIGQKRRTKCKVGLKTGYNYWFKARSQIGYRYWKSQILVIKAVWVLGCGLHTPFRFFSEYPFGGGWGVYNAVNVFTNGRFIISRFICFRIALQYKVPLSCLEALRSLSANCLTWYSHGRCFALLRPSLVNYFQLVL